MRVRVVVLLVFAVLGYMVVGGFVFNVLERSNERRVRQHTRDFLEEFLEKHGCVSSVDVDRLVETVVTAYDSGVLAINNASASSTTWDVPNSIFFAATVITTVGYGHLAPKTVAGRAFTAPYAILGIPICLVMLAGIGSKFNDIADALEKKIQVCKRTRTGKVVRVATLILVGVVLFLLIPGLCFMLVENWTYGEAVYYCFITLTTIGFGDFVAGVNSQREYSQLYRMGRTLWLFLGLAWLSTVIAAKQNTIQEFINKEELKYKSHERQKALAKMSEEPLRDLQAGTVSSDSDANKTHLKLEAEGASGEHGTMTKGSNGENSPAEDSALLGAQTVTENGASVQHHRQYGSSEQLDLVDSLDRSSRDNATDNPAIEGQQNNEQFSSSVTLLD